jgi:hypothetical protein
MTTKRNNKVYLRPIKFRKNDEIAIVCPDNQHVDEIIREIEGAEWSSGYKFWHLPLSEKTVDDIVRSLENDFTVDDSECRKILKNPKVKNKKKNKRNKPPLPSEEQNLKIEEFKTFCLSKKYTENTIKVYVSLLKVFLGWLNATSLNEISDENIHRFMGEYFAAKKYSENYKRLMENAIDRFSAFTKETTITKPI